MARASVIFENLADSATVTASSWIAAAPPSTLQNHHVGRRWKGRNGDTERISADLGSDQSISSICLFGCQAVTDGVQGNMTSAATTRVRASTAAGGSLAGDSYDSGSAASRISSSYGALVIHRPTPITARYIDIDLSQASATALLAGRLVIGLREQFTINFSYGWSYGYADLSRLRKSAGGQTFVDRDDRYRVLNLNFEWIETSERYGFVNEIDRINGISRDVLFAIDSDSATPDRDTIWGLMKDLSPPAQPRLSLFSKSYSIEERL